MAAKPSDRPEAVWHFSHAYAALAEAGAPDDVQRACLTWLRLWLAMPALPEDLLEQALEGANVKPIARKGEK